MHETEKNAKINTHHTQGTLKPLKLYPQSLILVASLKVCEHTNYNRLQLNCYNVSLVTFQHRLEESGVLTDCSIQTMDADETLDFDFTSANVVNKIIMRAECLREAFAELDMSSDVIEVLLSPSPPYFRLTTFGYAGTTQV